MKIIYYQLVLVFALLSSSLFAQKGKIPAVHSNIKSDNQGIYFELKGKKHYALPDNVGYYPEQFTNFIKGTPEGLQFDFKQKNLSGVMYYGFIPLDDSKYPQPVFFANTAEIKEGMAHVNIKEMKGRFDMIGWTKTGYGILGYRIVDQNRKILYDGKINFNATEFLATDGKYHEIAYGKKVYAQTKPFVVDFSIIEGPLVSNLTHESAVIFMKSNHKGKPVIKAHGKRFSGKNNTYHEIEITGLEPDTDYNYTVIYGKFSET